MVLAAPFNGLEIMSPPVLVWRWPVSGHCSVPVSLSRTERQETEWS